MISCAHESSATRTDAIDHARPFIPAAFCLFSHIAEAANLPPAIMLRQNQLQALYVLEMIQLFETSGRRALAPLAEEIHGTALGASLAEFINDEARHSAAFAALNRRAAPELYARNDHFFVRVPRWAALIERWLCTGPRRFPFWPWLMIIQEEKALHLSRAYLRDTSGLEPHFVAIHREHAADEAHHVGWDEELIEAIWTTTSARRRRFNARLLTWLMREFFHTPKRGGARLLQQLAREFPAHARDLHALGRPLAALAHDPVWHRTSYSAEMMPRSLAQMERWPEFAELAQFITHGRGHD